MKEEQAKILAHELTIEYIKAGSILLKPKESVSEIVDDFAYIYTKFYEAIIDNEILKKL